MKEWIANLRIYDDGTVMYRPLSTIDRPTLSIAQLTLVYRAAAGAEAAMGADAEPEAIIHLAAVLMARVSAQRGREKREAAIEAGEVAVR